jgi:hypothetical protein
MPFSKSSEEHTEEYWCKHFESFLKPIIESDGAFEAIRSEPLRGDVLKQIITDLVVCPAVVADLTDKNPNVFWELGVRQSFKHGTITIAEEGTRIPFDISVKGILFYYPKDHIKNAEFEKKFKSVIADCLAHPELPDSHVLETISGRGTIFQIFRRDEALRRLDALTSETSYNIAMLDHFYTCTEKGEIPAARLRSSCVELLISSRYLDERDQFYELAENCLVRIIAVNEQLALWEQFGETTVKWFNTSKERSYRELNDFQEAIKAAKSKISSLF